MAAALGSNFYLYLFMAIGSLISSFVNFMSYRYIKRTFDLKNNLYYLLAFDAVLVSVTSAGIAVLYTVIAILQETNRPTCTLVLFGYPMLVDCLVVCGFCLSLIRYKKMKRLKPPCIFRDARELKLALKLIVGYLIWYSFWVVLNTLLDLNIFHIYTICVHNHQLPQTILQASLACLFCMPMVLCTSVTIFMDYKCYLFLDGNSTDRRRIKRVDNVALRATLVGFCMLGPGIIACPILGYFIPFPTEFVKYCVTICIGLGVAILRNPVVALFTFRVNTQNMQSKAKETREAVLLKVLDEAKERKDLLKEIRIPNE